jgi:hypothetical protein
LKRRTAGASDWSGRFAKDDKKSLCSARFRPVARLQELQELMDPLKF